MILADTSLLIQVLRRHPGTMAFLEGMREAGEEFGTPSVCVAELLRGAHRDASTLATTVQVVEAFVEVPFGPRAARRYARLMHALDKAGRPLPALDGMIAAVALEEGARLATRDRRHFDRVAGLEVLLVP